MKEWIEKLDIEKNGLKQMVENGIQKHRKGDFCLALTDQNGEKITGARVTIEQKSHHFRFGCNAFMAGQFETHEKNEAYKQLFRETFNQAVVPFFWKDDEPVRGQWRFSKEAPYIYRRPSPEFMLDWCRETGVQPKAHSLVYHHRDVALPTWLLETSEHCQSDINRRIRTLAEQFADKIPVWDVVNEALTRNLTDTMPHDYALKAFQLAGKLFSDCHLIANENTDNSWDDYRYESSPYYIFLRHLISEGVQLDGVGMQYHLFTKKEALAARSEKTLNAEHLLRVLNTYAGLGRDIHISEVTLPAFGGSEEDDMWQEKMAENLYKIWFSGEKVSSVVWWNLVDGYAFVKPGWDEDYYGGGLIKHDFTPKPAFKAIRRLIREEWHTSLRAESNALGQVGFNGFYGDYSVRVEKNGRSSEHTISFRKGKAFYAHAVTE